jgi:DNA polymerase IIIc chi subunit
MKRSVCFLKVETVQEKLALICSTVTQRFHQGERWMLLAEAGRALDYLDELLWRFPSDSFLPHVIADQTTNEPIVLTAERRNLNQAAFAFSFLNEPLLEPLGFQMIFELEDLTSDDKKRISRQKRDSYINCGFDLNN